MLVLLATVLAPQSARGDDERPESSHWLDSELYPIRIHWVDKVTPDYVQRVRSLFEQAWRIQVDQWGWPKPLPDDGHGGDDKLDVYLADLAEGQADTVQDTMHPKPLAAASCYIQLDRTLPDDGTLESYVHHEFNHTLQFALDPYESDSFYEHTASLVERLLLPGNPEATSGTDDFQKAPHRSLDAMSRETSDRYEYGAGVFLHFLTERYGGGRPDFARTIWELSRQPANDEADDPNEPDWIDVLPQVLSRFKGPVLDDALAQFQIWRLEGSLSDKLPPLSLALSGGRPDTFLPPKGQTPAPWGANFLKLDPKQAKQVTLTLSHGGKNRWRLWAATASPTNTWLDSRLSPVTQGQASLDLPTGGARWVYAMVLNYGSTPHDPDRKQWIGHPYRLAFAWK